jgi:phosphatidylserine/phosphatidylglycerophosphate/cardiolipin synthase-like enzyme
MGAPPVPAKRARAPAAERLVLAPAERLEAVREVIAGARRHLRLSLFRCDDFHVLDALVDALGRGVHVEVLLTGRAKGGKKRLQELWALLESTGATLHRYADPVVKYHAKYIVADDGPALVASLNLTRKCFERTCDFLLTTRAPAIVSGLQRLFDADCRAPASSLPARLSPRLVIGPERARDQFKALIKRARRSIRVIDPKLTDPEMRTLLDRRRRDGLTVTTLGDGDLSGCAAHGKMMLIDERTAVIGSLSLSAIHLGFRREVAVVTEDPRSVSVLRVFFEQMARGRTLARAVRTAERTS